MSPLKACIQGVIWMFVLFVLCLGENAMMCAAEPVALRCDDSVEITARKAYENLVKVTKHDSHGVSTAHKLDHCGVDTYGLWFSLSGYAPTGLALERIVSEKKWVCSGRYAMEIYCEHGCEKCSEETFVELINNNLVVRAGSFIVGALRVDTTEADSDEVHRIQMQELWAALKRSWPTLVVDAAMLLASFPRVDRDGKVTVWLAAAQFIASFWVFSLWAGANGPGGFVVIAVFMNAVSAGYHKGVRPQVIGTIVISICVQAFVIAGFAYGRNVYNLLTSLAVLTACVSGVVVGMASGYTDSQMLTNLVFSGTAVYDLTKSLSVTRPNDFLTAMVEYLLTSVSPRGSSGWSVYMLFRGALELSKEVTTVMTETFGPILATAGTFVTVLVLGCLVFVLVRAVFGAAFTRRMRNESDPAFFFRCVLNGVAGYEFAFLPVISMSAGGRETHAGKSIMFAVFKCVEVFASPDVAIVSFAIFIVRMAITLLRRPTGRPLSVREDVCLLAEFNVANGSEWVSFSEFLRGVQCCYTVIAKRGDQVSRGCGAIVHAGGRWVLVTVQHVLSDSESVRVFSSSNDETGHEVFLNRASLNTVDDPCVVTPIHGYIPDHHGFELCGEDDIENITSLWCYQPSTMAFQGVSKWSRLDRDKLLVEAGFNRGDSGAPVFANLRGGKTKIAGVVSAGTTALDAPNIVSLVPFGRRVTFTHSAGRTHVSDVSETYARAGLGYVRQPQDTRLTQPVSQHEYPESELALGITMLSSIVDLLKNRPSGNVSASAAWKQKLFQKVNALQAPLRISRAELATLKARLVSTGPIDVGSLVEMVVSDDASFLRAVREKIHAHQSGSE